MELYVKLTELRKKNSISQSDAATKIGVSRQTISKWESGTVMPDMKNLALIAEVYNVSVEDLLNENFDINSYSANEEIDEIVENEVVIEEKPAEKEEITTEEEVSECECGCCCDEECAEEAEEAEIDEETVAENVYNKVKAKLADAKQIASEKISLASEKISLASEKISTIQVPKKAVFASLAAACATSALFAATLKKGTAKKTAAFIAGATLVAGAGLAIKDLYEAKKAAEAECECDEEACCCCCEAEIAENEACECAECVEETVEIAEETVDSTETEA